jgi:hypothetical protein
VKRKYDLKEALNIVFDRCKKEDYNDGQTIEMLIKFLSDVLKGRLGTTTYKNKRNKYISKQASGLGIMPPKPKNRET